MSKTSGAFVQFHEKKCAVVARLSEGRSPEFRSHRRMSPWNNKRNATGFENSCTLFVFKTL